MSPKKITTKDFIFRLKEMIKYRGRNWDYDFSSVEYVNSHTKVKVKCLVHDDTFETRPYDLLRGIGCPRCAGNKKYDLESFKKAVKEKHNDKYDYSRVKKFNSLHEVISIICKEHGGIFLQSAYKHLRGSGCPVCLQKKRLERFINTAKQKHGDRYDYSRVNYTSNNKGVEILCPIHGEYFVQIPKNHLRGSGCPKCAIERRKKTKLRKRSK